MTVSKRFKTIFPILLETQSWEEQGLTAGAPGGPMWLLPPLMLLIRCTPHNTH